MAKTYKMSVPLSLDKKHIDFIQRTGVGKNFSDKARSILDKAIESFDVLAEYDGTEITLLNDSAELIFEQNDGERSWSDDIPFPFNTKDGWEKLPRQAEKHGFICQVLKDENTGYVAVLVAPPKSKLDCKACRERIMEALENHG